MLTFVSSALRNDLNVWDYIKDVLSQLLAGETNYERYKQEGGMELSGSVPPFFVSTG